LKSTDKTIYQKVQLYCECFSFFFVRLLKKTSFYTQYGSAAWYGKDNTQKHEKSFVTNALVDYKWLLFYYPCFTRTVT
jgi:hypothetical protein